MAKILKLKGPSSPNSTTPRSISHKGKTFESLNTPKVWIVPILNKKIGIQNKVQLEYPKIEP